MRSLIILLLLVGGSSLSFADCTESNSVFTRGIKVDALKLAVKFRSVRGAGYQVYVQGYGSLRKHDVTEPQEHLNPGRDAESGWCLDEDPAYGMVVQGEYLYLARVQRMVGTQYEYNKYLIRYSLKTLRRDEVAYSQGRVVPHSLEKLGADALLLQFSDMIAGQWTPSLEIVEGRTGRVQVLTNQLHDDIAGKLSNFETVLGKWVLYWEADNSLKSFSLASAGTYVLASNLGLRADELVSNFQVLSSGTAAVVREKNSSGELKLYAVDLDGNNKKVILENPGEQKYCEHIKDSLGGVVCYATPFSPFLSCPRSPFVAAFTQGAAKELGVVKIDLASGATKQVRAPAKIVGNLSLLTAACQ